MIFTSKIPSYIGCLSLLVCPLLAAVLHPKELSVRAIPYMTRILDTGTIFDEENNGVWQLIE
jgi:hypothetical protein